MLVTQAKEKLKACQEAKDYPGMTEILTQLFTERGLLPGFSDVSEVVINFLSEYGGLSIDILTTRFEYSQEKAGLVMSLLRNFREFEG